jgi:hypothetical protein
MILKIIAVGAGISENFLGVSYQSTRAGALIQTEPDVKNFEDYREIMEEVAQDASERAFKAAGLDAPEADMEFTFPSLSSEDRSAKVKDIALAEAMDYFSKERAAVMVAREFDVTNFSYEKEKQDIQTERGEEPVIATGYQQLQKIAPDPIELAHATAEAGARSKGITPPKRPGPVPKAKGGGKGPSSFSSPADGGGRGLSKTKATLSRPNFSRGGEKKAIKNNHTTNVPRMAEAGSGWNDAARQKSIATRRRLRAERLTRLAEEAKALSTVETIGGPSE